MSIKLGINYIKSPTIDRHSNYSRQIHTDEFFYAEKNESS